MATTLKLDLAPSSQGGWNELREISRRESASRVSVLVRTEGVWPRAEALRVDAVADTDWVAIKVPSLDGTEIWLVPSSKQEAIELRIGFGKKSAPLLHFAADQLALLRFRDPFHAGAEIGLTRQTVPTPSLCGMDLREAATPISSAIKMDLQDLGSIAFEDLP